MKGARTAGYFGGHVVLGLVSASLGPTLPALAAQLSTVPEQLGLLFTARGLGYLLGSLACGSLYDRRPAHPLLVVAIVVLAATMAAVPLMPSRATLLALMLVLGGAQGLLDVGNNSTLVRVHGPTVAPYMNALHCCYGIGAIVAPFVVDAAGSLGWAYASLSLASLPVAVYLMALRSPELEVAKAEGSAESGGPAAISWAFALMFLFAQGAEAGYGGWLYVIAQDAGFGDASAARLVSGFWAAFTVGRVIAIVIATRVRPRWMLATDLLGALLAVAILLTVPESAGLWIGSLALGLSLASVFPAALALAGEYMTLSGAATSRIFVGASTGALTWPWLIGESFRVGPAAPIVLIGVDVAIAGAVFVAIILRRRGRG